METLKKYRDVPLVKILAGIRRCGKSTILEMQQMDLQESGIASNHIISMRFTSEDFSEGMTDKEMYQSIREKMTEEGKYYLLLDEVQEINGWEKAVNSLLENMDTDIYVTGSNSKLMSSEISTYLTGRYISIPVFTLSFAEYIELLRRDYQVYIGKNEAKEIDFVAVRRDERIYVQVCRNLPEESDREVANLLEIKDHYPKYVVTLDELAAGNINGVKIRHLADFLLCKEY